LPGFPIGRSTDRSLIGSSPWLIAAVHVLHRHLAPRHPPLALCSLGDLFFCLRVKMLVLALQFSRGVRDQFSQKVAGESEVPGALAATAAMATAGSSALPRGDTDTPTSRRTDGAGVSNALPQNGTVTLGRSGSGGACHRLQKDLGEECRGRTDPIFQLTSARRGSSPTSRRTRGRAVCSLERR
jgi:hypothetical protein